MMHRKTFWLARQYSSTSGGDFCFERQVITESGAVGTIEGSFGKSGKHKVAFPEGLVLAAPGHNSITLTFKRYIYDENKRNMVQ